MNQTGGFFLGKLVRNHAAYFQNTPTSNGRKINFLANQSSHFSYQIQIWLHFWHGLASTMLWGIKTRLDTTKDLVSDFFQVFPWWTTTLQTTTSTAAGIINPINKSYQLSLILSVSFPLHEKNPIKFLFFVYFPLVLSWMPRNKA